MVLASGVTRAVSSPGRIRVQRPVVGPLVPLLDQVPSSRTAHGNLVSQGGGRGDRRQGTYRMGPCLFWLRLATSRPVEHLLAGILEGAHGVFLSLEEIVDEKLIVKCLGKE